MAFPNKLPLKAKPPLACSGSQSEGAGSSDPFNVMIEPYDVAGIPVHPVTRRDLLDHIVSAAHGSVTECIYYANAHASNLSARDVEFREAIWSASLVICDGKGIQWASRLLGTPLPERLTPPDWIHALCDLAVHNGFRMFFLGGQPGVADAASARMREAHPGLQVKAFHGFFESEPLGPNNVIEQVSSYKPHLLVVGLGMPKQELWIRDNLSALDARVILAVGGMFDYISGREWRAPRWITDIGFEWLTRLLGQPRRLARRYIVGNPRFILRVGKTYLRRLVGPLPTAKSDDL